MENVLDGLIYKVCSVRINYVVPWGQIAEQLIS